ncbi:MAG: ABC transporter substrate-binding protein [bacterium]
MKIIRIFVISLIIFYLLCLLGCGKRVSNRNTIEFTDDMQRQVKVPRSVKRIVSMAPNVTEMLFAIGLNEEIVGVTDYCNYPEIAKEKTKIGGYYNPNIEVILSLKPDIIIATPDGYSKERVAKLEQAGISIFLVNPRSLDDIFNSMIMLGNITGKKEIAEETVKKLKSRVKIITDKVKYIKRKPKVFYELDHSPLITVGPNNFVDDLITKAGGINIANDAPSSWPQYSIESVIIKNPDIIITAPYSMGSGNSSQPLINEWKKYRTISAVINNRIYAINPDIVLRAGPRAIDGLESLYEVFHSEDH